jgi:hypothetical protein
MVCITLLFIYGMIFNIDSVRLNPIDYVLMVKLGNTVVSFIESAVTVRRICMSSFTNLIRIQSRYPKKHKNISLHRCCCNQKG